MKTKSLLIVLMFSLFPLWSMAQNDNSSEAEKIAIRVMTPVNNKVPNNALMTLYNNINQAVALNGLGSTSNTHKFVIVPVVNVVSIEASPTVPVQYVAKVEISLYLVDNERKIIMSQEMFTKQGIDSDENKAVAKAVRSLVARDPKIKKMIVFGKDKIIDYYNSECDLVMQKIQSYISRGMITEAVSELNAIPQNNNNMSCYQRSLEVLNGISKEKMEQAAAELQDDPDVTWITE